jgi:hypothetical protein
VAVEFPIRGQATCFKAAGTNTGTTVALIDPLCTAVTKVVDRSGVFPELLRGRRCTRPMSSRRLTIEGEELMRVHDRGGNPELPA